MRSASRTPLAVQRGWAAADGGRYQARRRYRLRVQVEVSLLGAGHGGDVLGQPPQPPGLGAQHGQGVLVGDADPVLRGVQVTLDGGQRGAHLVPQIGQDPAAGRLHRLQPGGHGVERRGEGVELLPQPGGGGAGGVVAVSDAGGGTREGPDGATESMREVPADAQRGGQRDQQGQAEGDGVCDPVRLLHVRAGRRVHPVRGAAQVATEDRRADGDRHHGEGDRPSQYHQNLGGEQPDRKAPPQASHAPSPMR